MENNFVFISLCWKSPCLLVNTIVKTGVQGRVLGLNMFPLFKPLLRSKAFNFRFRDNPSKSISLRREGTDVLFILRFRLQRLLCSKFWLGKHSSGCLKAGRRRNFFKVGYSKKGDLGQRRHIISNAGPLWIYRFGGLNMKLNNHVFLCIFPVCSSSFKDFQPSDLRNKILVTYVTWDSPIDQ